MMTRVQHSSFYPSRVYALKGLQEGPVFSSQATCPKDFPKSEKPHSVLDRALQGLREFWQYYFFPVDSESIQKRISDAILAYREGKTGLNRHYMFKTDKGHKVHAVLSVNTHHLIQLELSSRGIKALVHIPQYPILGEQWRHNQHSFELCLMRLQAALLIRK
jgi:hypothetical protein